MQSTRQVRKSRRGAFEPCHAISLSAFSTVSTAPRLPRFHRSARRRPEPHRCFQDEQPIAMTGRYVMLFQQTVCDRCQVGLDEVSQISDISIPV